MILPLFSPVEDRDHIQGTRDAPLTLVEYGDYECPGCAEAYVVVKSIQRRLGRKLSFVYRNFPLRQVHYHAESAAEAAEAAGAQGKFWPMHDVLFAHREDLRPAALGRYAVSIGVDMSRFSADLQQHAFFHRVQEDFISGMRSGVQGTPTFFVNGRLHRGSIETLLGALLSRLSAIEAAASPWEES